PDAAGSSYNLGALFTDASGGAANWTFTGGTNYNDQLLETVDIIINKADAEVLVKGYTGTYDATAHGASGTAYGVNEVDLTNGLTYNIEYTDYPGGNVIWNFAGGTNYLDESGNVDIAITKALLIITADLKAIKEGENMPAITYSFIGLVGTDIPDNPTYTMVPAIFNGAGVYTICPEANDNNYDITLVCDSLYVNPWGPGTKKIRSYLYCVTENEDGSSKAIFGWINDNTVPVYVPRGENNYFAPGEAADSLQLPELFPPGSGTFEVTYSGSTLTWTINSYESDHTSSTTTGVNQNSPKCTKSGQIAAASIEPDLQPSELKVYPNPTNGKVTINFQDEPGTNEVMVLDILGRTHQVEKTWIPSSGLEINLTNVVSGLYLIKVNTEETFKTFRIIKQ
ncbi:MAG: T9SS type A sorting domain-containing protein, partial [Bacteroidetes bacterium]|nr:T9SS type A sorting domain-containing protein [Bacteroidota bacterium]